MLLGFLSSVLSLTQLVIELATMWNTKILSLFLCLQTTAAVPFVTNHHTCVSYQGTSANTVEQFQNIRYAEDTSGANRFAPPIPYLPRRGSTVNATVGGDACPQSAQPLSFYPFLSYIENMSEDCLSLRIARPADLQKPLPVMVWLHGGGYATGQVYDQVYEPVGLVRESVASGDPVIWVATNYRVGMFGFAASEALQDAISENAGLRDQRVALQWVKDNIAAFGGDPDNITVYGQSAGSMSCALQMSAFGGQQGAVFQKAIMISGAINGDYSPGGPTDNTAAVAQSLNCSGNGLDSKATLACLRDVPLEILLPAALAQASSVVPPDGVGVFRPVIDDDFIPQPPLRLFLEGSFVKGISTIAAWTADDASIFVPEFVNSDATVVAFYGRSFSGSSLDKLLSLYPVEDFEAQVIEGHHLTAQWYRATRIYRDLNMACPSLNITGEISLQSNVPTYLFAVNSTRLQSVWDSMNKPQWQIAHVSDIPYIFNQVIEGADNSKSAMDFSAQVCRTLPAFATSGDPSTSLFDWPVAWKEGGGNATIFVMGGPYGAGPATVGLSHRAVANQPCATYGQSIRDVAQSPLGGSPSANDQRSEALAQERLVERCAFIDSVA